MNKITKRFDVNIQIVIVECLSILDISFKEGLGLVIP